MKKFKKKGFTLIELIAVLVIMAILALIVTPLVMSIIRKARVSADKRSVDAYGRSIELAIAGYLLDTGKFATSIDELTIEYSGNKVECETTQINPDSSVYLSNCKVNNREVTNYTYGTDKSPSYEAYSVGDEVTYNGVDYYVLKDSGTKDNVVTLLKATPLTTDEVNTYGGVGTENNIVNKYVNSNLEYYGKAFNQNGYGAVQYYGSDKCFQNAETSMCENSYDKSSIKYIIDNWSLSAINNIYINNVRLIYIDELMNLGYEFRTENTSTNWRKTEETPSWVYRYNYWTMSSIDDSLKNITCVSPYGDLQNFGVENSFGNSGIDANTVRPVVELYKNDGITRKNSSNN